MRGDYIARHRRVSFFCIFTFPPIGNRMTLGRRLCSFLVAVGKRARINSLFRNRNILPAGGWLRHRPIIELRANMERGRRKLWKTPRQPLVG